MVQETFSSTSGAEKLQALKTDMDKVASTVHENISTARCVVDGCDMMGCGAVVLWGESRVLILVAVGVWWR